jgi:hypothetical protein
MTDRRLRDQLERFVDWEEAQVGFDRAIDGLPAELHGTPPPSFEHTIWQLLEHMRIAQEDILDFCANSKDVHSRQCPTTTGRSTPRRRTRRHGPRALRPSSAAASDSRRSREMRAICMPSFRPATVTRHTSGRFSS